MSITYRLFVAALACVLGSASATAQMAVPVRTQALAELLIQVDYSAPADVQSLNTATLSAEVTGVVKSVQANVGQEVGAGQLLLDLDASDYQLQLEQAQANLAAAKAQKQQADARLKRAEELSARQYISADDLLARNTEVSVAAAQIQVLQSAVALARRNLEKCRVTSPFNGAVVERFAQHGSYVLPGSPLFRLVQTDQLELDAEIPDELVGTLQQSASMSFDSRGDSWPVRLLRLSPVVDPERRSRRARLEFSGETPAPGRSGQLVWRVDKGMLPANLIVRRDGQLGVFLNQSNTAVFTPLPAAQEGRPVAVNLPLDSEVVVQGRERLQDGDRIEPSR